jgi:predicted RNase H-like HicB family nuclease
MSQMENVYLVPRIDYPYTLMTASGEESFSTETLVSENWKISSFRRGSISIFSDYSLEQQEEGGFVAFSREYPEAVGQGETEEEAISDLQEAIQLLKDVLEENKVLQGKR